MAKESPGAASFDSDEKNAFDRGNFGGGMSASENRMANFKGRTIGKMGSPRKMTLGRDTSKDAKNCIGTPGLLTKPVSPSSNSQSRNKGRKK